MSALRYAARLGDCRVLGPGRRAVVWVHGCCFDCPGCIAQSFRAGPALEAQPQEMAAWFLRQGAEGLTVSGGEPMLQAEALGETIAAIRARRDCGVIVYTGFVYEDLLARRAADPALDRFLGQIDLLIDGPYRRELDRNQPYRGSENQRLLPLTGRYQRDLEGYYAAAGRQIELHLSERGTLMAGVPSGEQAAMWRAMPRRGEPYGMEQSGD